MASITFRLNQDAPVYDYKYYNKKKIKLQFGPRKAGIIFREGARETYDTHVSKKRLPAKPRSFSDIPAFLESSDSKEMQF